MAQPLVATRPGRCCARGRATQAYHRTPGSPFRSSILDLLSSAFLLAGVPPPTALRQGWVLATFGDFVETGVFFGDRLIAGDADDIGLNASRDLHHDVQFFAAIVG